MSADDDWLDTLAGRRPAKADRLARAEAELLRAALRHQQALDAGVAADALPPLPLPAAAAAAAPAAWWRCQGCAGRWQRLRASPLAWAGAGGAALALGLVLALGLPGGHGPQGDEVLRGASSPAAVARVLAVAQPAHARDDLADRLAAAGADVQRYERLGRFGLQARWAGDLPAALQADLQRLGLAPQGATALPLQVEFERQRP